MNNGLKKKYEEELVRAKARYDFQSKINSKNKPKVLTLYQIAAVFVYLLLGGIGIYALYRTYLVFM